MNLRLFTLALLYSSIGVLSHAQVPDTQPWLTDSSRAIQFGIGDYLTLRTFDAKALSIKCHLSATSAIRVGVLLYGSTSRRDSETQMFLHDSLISTSGSSNRVEEHITFELVPQYMIFFDTQTDLFFFIGAGPLLRYSYSGYTDSDWIDARSIGLGGSIGSEWFATHRFSIHAEYRAAILYGVEKTKYSNYDYTEVSHSRTISWRLESGRAIFGLSVYF